MMSTRGSKLLRLTLLALLVGAIASATAAAEYAPIKQPGPRLQVPGKTLRAALRCTPSVATDAREPILLVPGATMTPEEKFSWNYEPALTNIGLPYCTVDMPNKAMTDFHAAGGYDASPW